MWKTLFCRFWVYVLYVHLIIIVGMILFQVREMPNVLVLPRSADYSEDVWLEIREKAISILQSYFLDGAVPSNAVSDDEDEESEITFENKRFDKQDRERVIQSPIGEQPTIDNSMVPESSHRKSPVQVDSPSQHQVSAMSPNSASRSETKRSRSSKKAKKRHARQKSQHKSDDVLEKESISQQEDDTAMSGTEQAHSSGSRCASPEDSRNRKTSIELVQDSPSDIFQKSGKNTNKKSEDLLKDGCIIALHARDSSMLHVSRQRVKGGGWFLDTMRNVTRRDPAAQFLVVFGSKVNFTFLFLDIVWNIEGFDPEQPAKSFSCSWLTRLSLIFRDTIGLRSLAAGGKLLQVLFNLSGSSAFSNFLITLGSGEVGK